jgi:hypothetical protein
MKNYLDNSIRGKFLSVVILILILIGLEFAHRKRTQRIRGNIQWSVGVIHRTKLNYKSSPTFYYSFSFKDTIIHASRNIAIRYYEREKFINKAFPVAFSSKNPETSYLLVFPKDFKKFDLPFPDSLQWVNELK